MLARESKVHTKLRLGCVPEHFSTPIYLLNEKPNQTILELVNCPCGTGEMLNKLQEKSLDVAIVVTEGFLAAKLQGRTDLTVVGTYVSSPLVWAAATGFNKTHLNSLPDLPKTTNFAISRLNSGSHIMAQYLSQRLSLNQANYNVVGDLNKLSQAVQAPTNDLFLWERFTTKPKVVSQELKFLGEVSAPWPSFLWVTLKSNLDSVTFQSNLNLLIQQIQTEKTIWLEDDQITKSILNQKFHLDRLDASHWLQQVSFAEDMFQVDLSVLQKATDILKPILIQGDPTVKDVLEVDVKQWVTRI